MNRSAIDPTGPRGHVPTPEVVVDRMMARVFRTHKPESTDRILDVGCGGGAFIRGILRYCRRRGYETPQIVGVELDLGLAEVARAEFAREAAVTIVQGDLLFTELGHFDFVVGNPPYVPITQLSEAERRRFRARFSTAVERFDLYILFFERSLQLLSSDGRLCLITPEKFEYVHTATALRTLLTRSTVESIEHLSENAFEGVLAYPAVTTIAAHPPRARHRTTIVHRDGTRGRVRLPRNGTSWAPSMLQLDAMETGFVLADICRRISCGIATGADAIFVRENSRVPDPVRIFAYPTISGRQLGEQSGDSPEPTHAMLVPYDRSGRLLPPNAVHPLLDYVKGSEQGRSWAESRSGRKDWYRFHDNAPVEDIQQPKILCKDIAPTPRFWIDRDGSIIPRHSVYYIIPDSKVDIGQLLAYLNSPHASEWLRANCQRAANGYYRLQSSALKQLPIPASLVPGDLAARARAGHRTSKTSPRQRALSEYGNEAPVRRRDGDATPVSAAARLPKRAM